MFFLVLVGGRQRKEEDTYNVIGLLVFNTCGELLRTWAELQGSRCAK
jgi:hypothetical protein